jgi:hypothetical protein
VKDRKLVVNESEAKTVRMIFERFARVGSATLLAKALADEGVRTKRGTLFDKGSLYKLIGNRVYLGQAVHKGVAHPGEHEAILSQALWDRAHAAMAESPRKRAAKARAQTPALLKGLLFGPTGAAMSPTHTRKGGRLYRYYVSQSILKQGRGACPIGRVPAGEIEAAVINQLRILLRTPEVVVATWRAAKQTASDITEAEVRHAVHQFEPLWNELFPAEQLRIVQLLVDRIDVGEQGISIRLRTDGLASIAEDFSAANASAMNTRRAA